MKLKTNTAKCSQCMKKFCGRGSQNTRERKYALLKNVFGDLVFF